MYLDELEANAKKNLSKIIRKKQKIYDIIYKLSRRLL